MSRTISRRTVLKGMLGGAAVAVGLPLLEVFRDRGGGAALASGQGFPRRFGLFFWGNGVLPDLWVPSGEGEDYELSPELAPLAPVKDKVTVVSGMRVQTGNDFPHGSGPAGILSGAPLLVTGSDSHTFRRPSLDQVIAAEIGADTRFRSLEMAVEPDATGLSHNGPDSRNPPEPSPHALFQRIFGGGFVEPGEDPILDPRVRLRRSVLDAVMEQGRDLRARVGAADRIRIEQHFDAVRELERRLARLEEDPPTLASCARPEVPPADFPAVDGRPPLSDIHRAMVEILAMALACDQTRVFSLWFSHPVSNVLFPGASAGHHQLTHDEPGDQPQVHSIVVQIIEELAYLVERLAAVPEGDETLLDHTAILATTDCSYGRQHTVDEYPIVLAGRAGGALRSGFHHRSHAGDNTSKLGLTLLRAMGIAAGSFGEDGGHVTEGLGAIET